MRQILALRFVVFVIGFFLLSCSNGSSGSSADQNTALVSQVSGTYFQAKILEWTFGPEVSGDSVTEMKNTCRIEVRLADGSTPAGLAVESAYPFMKIHGHGAPDEQIAVTVEGEVVTVSNIAFTMSGPWELHLKVSANGQSEELEIPLEVP